MLTITPKELALLLGGEASGRGCNAPGPGHSAKDRSLSIKITSSNPDGFVVFSHCGDDNLECKDYVRSRLEQAGYHAAGGPRHKSTNGHNGPKAKSPPAGLIYRIADQYDYVDESHSLLYTIDRKEAVDPVTGERFKTFVCRRLNDKPPPKWISNIEGVRRVLYRLPQLEEAVAAEHPVFVGEGEKVVRALVKLGVPATTNPGGAGHWRDEYSKHFKGADCIILPDNNVVGEKHAKDVARSLTGIANKIRIVRLPGLPDGGDVVDWIANGGTVDGLWEFADKTAEELSEPLQEENPKPAEDNPDTPTPALTLDEWLRRELPEPDRLLGDLLTTTCRVLIIGPTGLGKTMFGLAAAIAIASNKGFLHWKARRKCRVLYVDGEMSRRQMKRRLQDAVHRGGKPEGLFVLSKEDFEDLPPLNTPQGQKWIDDFLEKNGPFDLVIFDNIQALLVGDMRDEEQWLNMLPWVRSLTRRSIGQLWFHHTGHDESKGYGTKTREWQMDTVGLMERVKDTDDDIAFTLTFTKARERNPDNRSDFEPVTMSLRGDEWLYEKQDQPDNRRMSDKQELAYEALTSLSAEHGEPLPPDFRLPSGTLAVSVTAFKAELLARGIVSGDAKNPRSRLDELLNALKRRHAAGERKGRVWPLPRRRWP
jgi:hypothetical protein